MLKKYHLRDYDFKLILFVVALTIIGIFAIGSASNETLQSRQLGGFIFGFFLMITISFIDYSMLLKLYWPMYFFNLILLLLVLFIGKDAGGAQRWVNIFGIQFQPSETAKIMLILFFAQFIMKQKEQLNTGKIIIACCLLVCVPIFLIYKQPDLSTSIMVVLIFCSIMFIGGLSLKVVIGVLAIIIPTAAIFLSLVLQPDQTLIKPYQQQRILAWLNPSEYATSTAYQQMNSIMAIGSGQLYGKGYNNNEITSVKNGNFISEPQTDFIYAIIGEEFGFVGAISVIILLVLIALECVIIAKKSKDLAGTIIATGMGVLVGMQGFMNIGVATGIMPNTGIPLPFVSYGLTSLVSLYIGMGFVLNVRLQAVRPVSFTQIL